MAPSSRDRISVDLQGLKVALCERAQAAGILPSALVREALADALGKPTAYGVLRDSYARPVLNASRARLSLRMTRAQAEAVVKAAHRVGMSPGDYVANLVAGVPVLTGGASRAEHVAALITSCAELSSFSRNVHRLASLLREGSFRAVQEYQVMLDMLAGDVEAHLTLASRVLAELRPRDRAGDAPMKPRR